MEKQWWDEEIHESYSYFLEYWYMTVIIATGVKFFMFTFIRADFLLLMCIPFTLLIYLGLWFLKHKSGALKIFIVIFSCEMFQQIAGLTSLTGYSSCKYAVELFSFLLLTNFELPMIKSRLIFNLMIAKHLYVWHAEDLKDIDLSSPYCSEPISIILIIFTISNLGRNFRLRRSLERFSYRRQIEIKDEKLKGITQAYTEGILIFSLSKNILFYNLQVTQLLKCEENQLEETIKSLKYCEGKKLTTTPRSNGIIDDIYYLLDKNESGDNNLGVNLLENLILEWKTSKIRWENADALFVTVRNAKPIIDLEKSIANDQMKTVLLRSVSHELRTPLNAITFFTNEVKDESAEISVADKEKLHIVSISAKLVLTLIDDLMDYSKMLSGVFSVNKSNCNIREIIYKTSDLIKYQAIKKNLGIYIRIDPETPNTVYTDSLRLSQILLNLLSNALKFTLRGNIEICLAMCTEDRIKIYVQDTGIGIQDAIKTKLFTEFNTSNIQNINPQGSGLGLSISNVLAKELGGKPIKVKSKVGKGSIFRFSINTKIDTNAHSHYDLVEMAESENCFPIHIPYYDTTRKRIDPQVLIVDDNEFNRIILCTILKKFNIEFSEACSGKEAIEKIIKQDKLGKPFKAIIMDCMMPELNGWETTAALHVLAKQGKISKFPNVIGHSAFTNDEDKKMCFNCGMLDHLEKPSTPDKIMSTLKRFIYD